MTDDTPARKELSNGLVIDAENPELHEGPNYCKKCRVFYYFGHICRHKVDFPIRPHTAMKRGMKGYFDGEEKSDKEKVKQYFEKNK